MSALIPRPGRATRLTLNNFGFSVSATNERPSFRHPWRASLIGLTLRIEPGKISFREPTNGEKPMSQAPLIKLQSGKQNKSGESWIVVEAEINADKTIDAKSRLELVQVSDPLFFTPALARFPVVMILWSGSTPVRMEQVAFWNAVYHQIPDGASVQHLFL